VLLEAQDSQAHPEQPDPMELQDAKDNQADLEHLASLVVQELRVLQVGLVKVVARVVSVILELRDRPDLAVRLVELEQLVRPVSVE